MDHSLKTFSLFQEKLHQLLHQAHQLIVETKEKKPYNEGLVCLLSSTIQDLEKISNDVIRQEVNEELSIDAQMVKNVLEQPIYPNSDHRCTSLLAAARKQNHSNDTEPLKEIILACVLDQRRAEVLLDDLKELSKSIDEELLS
ncbi:MAG: hypothetical protein EBU93_02625 [Chlamydiae bacterium]|jgi:hypothetical protein|nr:hypothetical protein [Chlamydiota bacterium]